MADGVCVDASLAIMWVLLERYSEEAERLRDSWLVANMPIFAPPLFRAEVTSVIREQQYRGEMSEEDGQATLDVALNWPVQITDPGSLLQQQALALAARFNRPRAYDAQYLALAQIAGCELWTGDRRLVNSLQGELPWVKWVGDFSPGP